MTGELMEPIKLYNGLRTLCSKYNATITFSYTLNNLIVRIYGQHNVSMRMKTIEKHLSYDDASMMLTTGYINMILEEEFNGK
jgi:hypothetical protein